MDNDITQTTSTAVAGDIAEGSRIGTYEVRSLLGVGAVAQVYEVWHVYLHRREAMKLLPARSMADVAFVQRFLNEARTAAALHHPNIATIYTVSVPDSPQPYFTMELLEGGDLAGLLEREGPLPVEDALVIIQQIGLALDYAHSQGVIHRDVKPANVLLKKDEGARFVKVVDFGIARAHEEKGGTRLTNAGVIIGTPAYMSPEQAGSGPPVDHRTDIYSLGIVAYEMLCGVTPFEGGADATAMSVIMRHIREQPVPLTEHVPGIPAEVNDAILKALAKDPEQRFANCEEFVEAMRPKAPANFFARRKTQQITKAKVAQALAAADAAQAAPQPAPTVVAQPAAAAQPTVVQPPQKKANYTLPLAVGALLLLGAGAWALLGRSGSDVDEDSTTTVPRVRPTKPETGQPKPQPHLVAKPSPAAKPKAVAQVAPKPQPKPKPVAKTSTDENARAAAAATSARPVRRARRVVLRRVVEAAPVRRRVSEERPRRAPRRRRVVEQSAPRRSAVRRAPVSQSAPRRVAPRRTAPHRSAPSRAPELPF